MSISTTKPIGLFDSGLGGLTVLRELQIVLPEHSYTYLGDNARFPYGTKSVETIIRYSRECAQFLLKHEVGLVVVACNTASATALSILEQELPVPIIGTVGPAVREALEATRSGIIGVLGTSATIASHVYENSLRERDASIRVISQACPLFVPLVEAGMLEGEIVDKVIELYLAPLKAQQVDTVILGCTHYPLLLKAIQSYLGPDVAVVECSRAIAADVQRILANNRAPAGETTQTQYFVTDEVGQFNQLAALFLGERQVQAVRIESF